MRGFWNGVRIAGESPSPAFAQAERPRLASLSRTLLRQGFGGRVRRSCEAATQESRKGNAVRCTNNVGAWHRISPLPLREREAMLAVVTRTGAGEGAASSMG